MRCHRGSIFLLFAVLILVVGMTLAQATLPPNAITSTLNGTMPSSNITSNGKGAFSKSNFLFPRPTDLNAP